MSDVRRVLLVDDEDDIRAIAELSLRSLGGWDVRTATSGVDALRVTEDEAFDVIVLDVMMPELDGPSTLARLREAGVTAPVVFLTAKVQPADRRDLAATGAAGLVAKPFDPMRLPADVDEHVQRLLDTLAPEVPT